MCTGDTDILILLISILHLLQEFSSCNVLCKIVLGDNINDICRILGNDVCNALPFSHAFTGCDTVSSFYNHSKVKVFDAWMNYEEKLIITKTFQNLCDEPRDINDDHIAILENLLYLFIFQK